MFFLVFLLLFAPRIYGTFFDLITFTSILIILYATYIKVNVNLNVIFTIIAISIINVFWLIGGLNSESPQTYLYQPIRIPLEFLGIYFLFEIHKKTDTNNAGMKFIRYIYLSIVLHSFIMILQFINDDFRQLSMSFTGAYNLLNKDGSIYDGRRVVGLTYGQSLLSVIQSFGIFLLLFLRDNGEKGLLFNRLFYLVILFSIIISGRTGLLILLGFLPFYYLLKSNNKIAAVLIISVSLFFSIWFLSFIINDFCNIFQCNNKIQYQIYRLEEIYNIVTKMNSIIFQIIFFELKIPNENILFGGLSTHIEPGYFRDLYEGGLIYVCLKSSLFLFFLFFSFLMLFHKKIYIFVPFIIMSILISHLKEPAIFSRGVWTFMSLMIVFLLNSKFITNEKK